MSLKETIKNIVSLILRVAFLARTAPKGKWIALDSGTRVVLATEYIDKTVDTERSILRNALILAHHLLFARIKDLQ